MNRDMQIAPPATEINQQLLAVAKLALSSRGVWLTSNPPQDAWDYNRVSEKLAEAIAAAEKELKCAP